MGLFGQYEAERVNQNKSLIILERKKSDTYNE